MDSRLITVNELLFNGGWVDGVEHEITSVTGMGEPADVFTSDQNIGADGGWATTGFRASRAVGLEGVVRGVNAAAAELAADRIRHLFDEAVFPRDLDDVQEIPVTLHYASGDRTVWCRKDGELAMPSRESPTEFSWSVVLKCLDQRIYVGDQHGSGVINLSTGLPHSTGGLTYPITYPITYTGSSATGDVQVTLQDRGYLTFQIRGPVTDPQILVEDHSLNQYRLAWLGTLPADVWLDVDPQKEEALLQGQSSRVPYIRQWPKLGRGPNTFRFRAASYDAGRLDITIQPTL